MLIDGGLLSGAAHIDVVNPANGKLVARAPRADAGLVERAVTAAKRATGAWGALAFAERGAMLSQLADGMNARFDDLAGLLTEEQGKPLAQACHEIGGAIAALRYFAGLRIEEEILFRSSDEKVVRHRTPLGVVVAIAPWNFPVLLMVMKLAPALMAGNAVICKPAPTTPLTTLLIGEIGEKTFPPGVLSTLVDESDLGSVLTCHPDVAKISFTGSTGTGRKVMASAALGIKRLSLELGGNDAAIVLDDADVKTVAPHIFLAATLNAGQICFAAKRVYAPALLYERLCAELAALARAAVVGDGRNPETEIGPIQNRQQYEKLLRYLEIAKAEGQVIVGGEALEGPGFFISPTVVRDIPDTSALVQEEQFGPIIPIVRYEDLDQVIAQVNSGDYGLGATIWTSDPERGLSVARRIDAGVVWVNRHLELGFDIPMSGARQSGLGVENGQEGLESFTQSHIVSVRLREANGQGEPAQ